jgi:hypothetical protein
MAPAGRLCASAWRQGSPEALRDRTARRPSNAAGTPGEMIQAFTRVLQGRSMSQGAFAVFFGLELNRFSTFSRRYLCTKELTVPSG